MITADINRNVKTAARTACAVLAGTARRYMDEQTTRSRVAYYAARLVYAAALKCARARYRYRYW
jgi:hypothetical protein